MRNQPPQKTALQVVGVLAGTASVLYFVYTDGVSLSPVTRSLVGLFVAVGLAAASLVTDDAWDTVSLYLLSGVAFLGASIHLLQTYRVDGVGTLVVLLALTVVALGVSRNWGRLTAPSTGAVRVAVAVAVVLSLALVGVDLGTGGVTHSIELTDRVTVSDGYDREVRLGTVTYRNPSPVPKEGEYPRYEACLVGVSLPDRYQGRAETGVSVDFHSHRLVSGGGSVTLNATTYLPREVANTTTTFTVVGTDACPDSAATPTVAVYERPRRY
ncbi:hypothetical protein ACFO0N_06115 [Halobium salinum]|uniref:DUF1109 domain-containing protein n=1 Tax=Halobium salinum TaxID=1364940 RepID=A0ABD5P9I3_9EURY|nr:hypothetical protein [Halobium salinum]